MLLVCETSSQIYSNTGLANPKNPNDLHHLYIRSQDDHVNPYHQRGLSNRKFRLFKFLAITKCKIFYKGNELVPDPIQDQGHDPDRQVIRIHLENMKSVQDIGTILRLTVR